MVLFEEEGEGDGGPIIYVVQSNAPSEVAIEEDWAFNNLLDSTFQA